MTRPNIGTSAFYFSADQIQRNMPTSFGLSRGGGDARQIYLNHSAYIQDEWQFLPRLSFSLGLRWDVNPAPTAVGEARLATLDQIENLATAQLMPEGTPLWKTQYANLAPRFGLAYRLRDAAGWETGLGGWWHFL